MPSDWDVTAAFRLRTALGVISWGLFILYVSFRKKLRFLLFLSIALLIDGITRYIFTDVAFSSQAWISIGLLIAALILGWREFAALDQSGKTPRDVYKPDWIDLLVLISFLIGRELLRRICGA